MATFKKAAIPSRKATSPQGLAIYAKLKAGSPDTTFGTPGTYSVQLGLALDQQTTTDFIATLEAMRREAAAKLGVKPEKISLPLRFYDDDEPEKRKPEFEGLVRLVTKSKHAPPTVDGAAKPVPATVWAASGDTIRVAVGLGLWSVSGKHGISAYLNGVQIVQKRSAGGGFDAIEGGFEADTSAVANSFVASATAGDEEL